MPVTAKPIESAFQFCPQCGQPNDVPGSIPFRCRHCQLALFFGPVAAVGALIIDDQNRLLMVRRSRDPGRGKWGLPGGFVDRGETIEEALHREVLEETGLRITVTRLLVTAPNQYVYAGVSSPVIDLFYVCRAVSIGDLQLAADELEHFEWVWPTPLHLNNMAFPSNRLAIELWMRSLGNVDPASRHR